MSKPSIGRIVHVIADRAKNNGSDVAAAVITRVWNDTMINVKVLTDGDKDYWQTSINLYDERPQDDSIVRAAWWPPRVDG